MRLLTSKLPPLVYSCFLLSGIACSGTDAGTAVGTGGDTTAGGSLGAGGNLNQGGATISGSSQLGGLPNVGGSSNTGGLVGAGGVLGTGGDVNAGGTPTTGGAVATGGAKITGGNANAGGSATTTGGSNSNGGSLAAGGTTAGTTGGVKSTGGTATAITGGTKSTGGTTAATGGTVAATGGSKATGGAVAAGGNKATGGAPSTSGCGSINDDPFNCKFAWGAASSGTNYSYLNFVSTWVGDETNGGLSSWSATGTNSGQASQSACGDCALVKTVSSTSSMVVFYTYFIGYQACKQGKYCDCNTSSPPNLCTNGSQWIRDNRATIVNAYGQYAKAVYANSPSKPVIWWLEGDFVQYTVGGGTTQTNPLSYAEAGQLARDITCAIKSNEPNAIVAMNHSPWNSDAVSQGFWAAQPTDVLDLIWVQGPGDSDTLTNSGTYNATTANYNWLHTFTGKKIMVETSFAGSGAADRWSTTTAANINARIANGVIGVHVNSPASNYQTAFTALNPGLSSTCN